MVDDPSLPDPSCDPVAVVLLVVAEGTTPLAEFDPLMRWA